MGKLEPLQPGDVPSKEHTKPQNDPFAALAQMNAGFLNTAEQAAQANANALNIVNQTTAEAQEVQKKVFANLGLIEKFEALDPQIPQLLGIFNSKFSRAKQERTLAAINNRVNTTAESAKMQIQLNKQQVDLEKQRVTSARDMIEFGFKAENLQLSRERYRLELDAAERAKLDKSIGDMSDAQLQGILSKPEAKRGEFAGKEDAILQEQDAREVRRLNIIELRGAIADKDQKRIEALKQEHLASYRPSQLQETLQEMERQGSIEGTLEGLPVTRKNIMDALAVSTENENRVEEELARNTLAFSQVQRKVDYVSKAAFGLNSISPDLVPSEEMATYNEVDGLPTGVLGKAKAADLAAEDALKAIDERIAQVAAPYKTEEGKAGITNYLKNGGRFSTPEQASTVLSETMIAAPGVIEGGYFVGPLTDLRDKFSTQLAKSMGVGEAKTDADGNPIFDQNQLLSQTARLKANEFFSIYMNDPSQTGDIKAAVAGKAKAIFYANTIERLATPTKDDQGVEQDVAPIWIELNKNLEQFRANPDDFTSAIDPNKILSFLSQKEVESQFQEDYIAQFLNAMQATKVNFNQSFHETKKLSLADRAVVASFFGSELGNSIGGRAIAEAQVNAAQAKAQTTAGIAQDLAPQSTAGNPFDRINSEQFGDIPRTSNLGGGMSATGLNLTADKVRQLMEGQAQ